MNEWFPITRLLIHTLLIVSIGQISLSADDPAPVVVRSSTGKSAPPVEPFQSARRAQQQAAASVRQEARSIGFKRVWIQWESERPQRITGKMAFRDSQILSVHRLGTSGDEVAAVQYSSDTIDIFATTPQTNGGFVLDARLTAASLLLFGLQGEHGADAAGKTHEVALAKLGKKPAVYALPGGIRVTVHLEAMPTKLIYPRPHLIFRPGETFRFEVLLDEVPTRANAKMRCAVTLQPARGGEVISEVVQEVLTDPLGQFQNLRAFAIDLPTSEGAYEVDLQITSAAGESRPATSTLYSRRKLQLVVLDEKNTADDQVDTTGWKLMQEVDLQQLAQVDASQVVGETTDLGPGAVTRAVLLAGTIANQPHIVELVCSGEEPAEYRVSILQEANQAVETIVRSDFHIDGRSGSQAKQQLVFWPNDGEVAVQVTRHGAATAEKSTTQLKIYAGPKSLPAMTMGGIRGQRTVAAYLDSPEMGLRFGVTKQKSSAAEGSNDWKYYLDSATRQTQLLNNAGYSAAMLTVAASGGAIYPSNHIEPSQRFDDGLWIPDGGGAPQKDILELMFQIYDREGMVLIPTVRFDFPIADLERRIVAGDRSLRMLNEQQQNWWSANPQAAPQGPYYNPAHPDVQAAMQQIVQELVDGYSRHASFGGVAVVVDSSTSLQFPGDDWGVDTASRVNLKSQQKQRDAKLNALFVRLGTTLTAGESKHKLFVIDQIAHPTAAQVALRRRFNEAKDAPAAIVWVAGSATATAAGSSRRGSAEEVRRSTTAAAQLKKRTSLLLPTEDSPELAGDASRGGWIHEIAAADPDIIVHPLADLSFGQLEARRNLLTAMATLPVGTFYPVSSSQTEDSTVMLRTASSPVACYGYVVNNSAWASEVQIRFDDLGDVQVETVADTATARPRDDVWQVRVPPYDMISFRVPKPGIQIVDWNMQREQADTNRMRQWLTGLKRHLDAAANLRLQESTLLLNSDFSETNDEGQVADWELANGAGMTLQLVHDDSQKDKAISIQTESPLGWPTPPIGWVRSTPFNTPQSGRLLCIARVRAADDFANTRVKMVVTGQIGDQVQEESVWIDATMPKSVRADRNLPTDTPYRHVGIQILDIPSHQDNQLQVSFEVHDGGKVWIDHVGIYDRFVTSEEIQSLETMHEAALAGVQADDFGNYLALRQAPLANKLLTQTPLILDNTAEELSSINDESIALIEDSPVSHVSAKSSKTSSPAVSRNVPPKSSRRVTVASISDNDQQEPTLAALDDLHFGMIGSEPKLPPQPKPLNVARASAGQRPIAQQVSQQQPTVDRKADKPSLRQRIVGWFRGSSNKQDASDNPFAEQAQESSSERVSAVEGGRNQRK